MKRLYWIGSSLSDMKRFPPLVKQTAGYALFLAQEGDRHPDAKVLKGFSGAGGLVTDIPVIAEKTVFSGHATDWDSFACGCYPL